MAKINPWRSLSTEWWSCQHLKAQLQWSPRLTICHDLYLPPAKPLWSSRWRCPTTENFPYLLHFLKAHWYWSCKGWPRKPSWMFYLNILHTLRGPFRSYQQLRLRELSRLLGRPTLFFFRWDLMPPKSRSFIKSKAEPGVKHRSIISLSHPILAFSMPLNNRNAVPLTVIWWKLKSSSIWEAAASQNRSVCV